MIPVTNLDLGDALNAQYKIEIVGDDDVRIGCEFIEVENDTILCEPDSVERLHENTSYYVEVRLSMSCHM